jgi:hypothetical protein
MRRLLKPGARPDLVAMICDAQVYISPEQRAAEDERTRNDQEATNSHEAAMELEFRQWQRTIPRGTRHEWEVMRHKESQERLEQQAAEHRARLVAEKEQAQRDQLLRRERDLAERRLNDLCRLLKRERRPLFVNGKPLPDEGCYGEVSLLPECWGRGG